MGHGKKRKHNQEQPISEEQKQESSTDIGFEIVKKDHPKHNETSEGQGINRRARIIVRNLSFKTTEAKLKEFFEKFGPVLEVQLLKRPDGKLVGCGFIQYEVTQNAAKAIFDTSGKPFLGRNIVCDWALGKDTYVRNMQEAVKHEVIEIKEELKEEDDDKTKIKIEDVDTEMKTEKPNVEDSDAEDEEPDAEDEESDAEDEESDAEDEESDSEDEKSDAEEDFDDDESQITPEIKRPRVVSNDVQEGKTVFIKNVPFSATNNDIKQCMEKFGPLYYALVCVDRLTEHSKGTAFVKFQNLEDAEKCLEAGTELTLMGQILDCHKAVNKTDLDNKPKKEIRKDSRNLYLIKEGVILAGSRAAQTISASDMAKRLDLEKWKTQILRNLNMFISRNRLIIHNLPQNFDDKDLRELFERFSGPKAVIKEIRVMKDLRNLGTDGKPVSKEHGFVSFADHEDALKALRGINNNPSIFTRAKRPIVAFSIENKAVINARHKRLLKSQLNNPESKNFRSNKPVENQPQNNKQKKQKFRARDNPQNENEYTGVTSKPGRVDKMRSKYKLTTQAQLHQGTLKSEKQKKMKLTRRVLKKKKDEYLKQNKQTKSKGKGQGRRKPKEDNFTKIVDKYKSNTAKGLKTKKRKWFDK